MAGYRTCENVVAIVIFAMDKEYLYPKPSNDVTIMESDLNGLIIPDYIFYKLKKHIT